MSAAAVVEKRVVMSTETKTFRGSSLEEVLPKIKADLGPDAEIVRQREGLTGGVGGFFQRACIEVDARAPESDDSAPRASGRRSAAYDDEPAIPEPLPSFEPEPLPSFEPDPLPGAVADAPTAEGLSAPGIQEIMRQAAPFADHLDAAARQGEPAREAEPRGGAGEPEAWRPDHAFGAEPEPAVERSLTVPAHTAPARPQIADAIEQQLREAGISAARAKEIVDQTVSHLLPFAS